MLSGYQTVEKGLAWKDTASETVGNAALGVAGTLGEMLGHAQVNNVHVAHSVGQCRKGFPDSLKGTSSDIACCMSRRWGAGRGYLPGTSQSYLCHMILEFRLVYPHLMLIDRPPRVQDDRTKIAFQVVVARPGTNVRSVCFRA